MIIEFKVQGSKTSLKNQNGEVRDYYFDMANVLYCLKANSNNINIKVLYAVLSSGIMYGFATIKNGFITVKAEKNELEESLVKLEESRKELARRQPSSRRS